MENDDLKQQAMQELARRELVKRTQSNPDMQGGALSPANVKAQQDQKQAEAGVSLPAQVGMAAKAVAEPVGRMANSAMFGIPGITSELLSGGKMVNPMTNGLKVTQGGTNVFEGKDMSPGQQLSADIGGAFTPGGLTKNALNIVGKLGNKIIEPIKEGLQLSKELGQTAKEVGAPAKSSDSIVRTMGLKNQSDIAPLQDALNSEKSNFQDIKESLNNEMANQKGLKTDKIQLTKDYAREVHENRINDLENNKNLLKEAIQGKAEGIAKYLKEDIPQVIQSMNETFGKEVDNIGSAMENAGKGVTNTDNFNILNKTMDEANGLGINTGRAKALLDKLHGEATKAIQGEKINTGLLDNNGNQIIKEVQGSGEDVIPFRDFLNQTREFRRILSDSKLSGAKGLNDEDIVGSIYYKNLGKYMEDNIPGYKGLQKDYAPVINAMKTARRIFRPGDVYSDEQGINLLKRYATGSTSSGKEQLFNDIQSSSRFGNGVQDVTSGIKNLGDKLKNVESQIADAPINYRNKLATELKNIRNEHEKAISSLSNKLKDAEGESQIKSDSLKDQIADINSNFDDRINRVKSVNERLSELKKRGVAAGVLATVGLGEFGRKGEDIKHLIMR